MFLYNHQLLRSSLKKKGYKFKTDSDAEVILGFETLKIPNYQKSLDGLFSYLVVDLKKNTVKIVRDSQGQKPLYFYADKSSIYISSDSRVFSSRKLNIDSLNKYNYFSYIPSENTMSEGISQLTPGYKITFKSSTNFSRVNWAKRFNVRPTLNSKSNSKIKF